MIPTYYGTYTFYFLYSILATIIELNKKLSQMQNDNDQLKATSKQEISLLNLALEEKEKMISVQRSERDSIESDKDRIHAIVTQQEK